MLGGSEDPPLPVEASRFHSLVLPAIRFGPGRETLSQAIAAIRMLRGDIALLVRVGLQIVDESNLTANTSIVVKLVAR